jgi:hypothetical protein
MTDLEAEMPAIRSAVTIVEQEDVAFALGLCREVHRIYGDYLEGRVYSNEPLEAGLMMTIEMLAILSGSVDSGMPAMRIGVAAAQVTEMLSVLFNRNWVETPLRPKLRDRYRAALGQPPAGAGGELAAAGAEPEAPGGPGAGTGGAEPAFARRGLRRLFRRRRC